MNNSIFILSFKHTNSGEMLYFYCTAFRNKNEKWVIVYENHSILIPHNCVELLGTVSEGYVHADKDKIYYPFEFNTALL